tara:strand:+ start:856 stop:1218 length:363 start_codon:yes stop_codon:yes gene_type:complete
MKHLIPTTDSQTIKIIPRVYATSITIKLRDDSTNEEVIISPTAIVNKNYVEVSAVFTLVEGRFYDLKIYNGQGAVTDFDIIYRDKIFCTAQSTNQTNNDSYTVNKDVYVEKSGNNDFIII